jgi:hypothetical protein
VSTVSFWLHAVTKKGPTPKRKDARRTRIVGSAGAGQLNAITDTGIQYPVQDAMGQWTEPTDASKHQWQAIACFNVSQEAAATAYVGVEQVPLDMENLVAVFIACMKCEQPFTLDFSKTPCKGEPNG